MKDIKLKIIIGLMFCLVSAQAQNIIRPKIACPNDIWVNSYNGVLFYQRVDLSIPNRGMDLEAVFYYNSSYNTKNYGYGNGWSLGYEMRYIEDSLGIICPNCPPRAAGPRSSCARWTRASCSKRSWWTTAATPRSSSSGKNPRPSAPPLTDYFHFLTQSRHALSGIARIFVI